MTRRSRDKHVEVAAAMRQAIRRANGARLSEGEHRTFAAGLALTAGFGRLWDDVYVAEVRELTGPSDETRLHEVTVRKHLLGFAERGIFEWEPRRGTDAAGKGFRSRLGLPTAEQTERREQTERQEQSEPDRRSVSSEGQTESTLGDRVKQPPHGEERDELQGVRTTSRTRTREDAETPEEKLEQDLDGAREASRQTTLFPAPHRGAYDEPGAAA